MKLGKLSQRLNRSLGVAPAEAPESTLSAALGELKDADTRAAMKGRIARWLGDADYAVRHGEAVSLKDASGGYLMSTPYGDALVIDSHFPISSSHGNRRVGALYDWKAEAFGELESLMADSRLSGFDPRRTLFLDIEASGLQHGAGTYAFLVGLGFLEGDEVIIRQVLLQDQGCEQAMLHIVAEHVDQFEYLSSFNGKSYDLTVLISRLVMHHFFSVRDCDLKLRPHLDLLHLSKNIYKRCWDNTKLQTLEREALGFERVDDVPGSLVPTCWYHYLRTGQPGPVLEVVKHNLYDVLSMVTLADRLVADVVTALDVQQPASSQLSLDALLGSSGERQRVIASVDVNLGALLLRRRRPEEALACLLRGIDALPEDHPLLETAFRTAVTAARRAGDLSVKGSLIDRWCDAFPANDEAFTALSIHEERVRKALRPALVAARRAQAIAPSAGNTKRVHRLIARIERTRGVRRPVLSQVG